MQKTEIRPLEWVWQQKPTELTKLKDGQLYAVKTAIINSKKKRWFGIDSKIWLKEVNQLIKIKSNININELHEQIKRRRLEKALKNADIITNGIIKSMNKNL